LKIKAEETIKEDEDESHDLSVLLQEDDKKNRMKQAAITADEQDK
jgi:hypothetical protein